MLAGSFDLEWWEWVGLIASILTPIGMIFTFVQARKAKTASEAAMLAAESVHRDLSTKQALTLIPRLRTIAVELEQAAEEGDERWVRRRLEAWRWEASHVHGLLQAEPHPPKPLLRDLAESTSLAAIADREVDGENDEVSRTAANWDRSRGKIQQVCVRLSEWAGKRSGEIGGA